MPEKMTIERQKEYIRPLAEKKEKLEEEICVITDKFIALNNELLSCLFGIEHFDYIDMVETSFPDFNRKLTDEELDAVNRHNRKFISNKELLDLFPVVTDKWENEKGVQVEDNLLRGIARPVEDMNKEERDEEDIFAIEYANKYGKQFIPSCEGTGNIQSDLQDRQTRLEKVITELDEFIADNNSDFMRIRKELVAIIREVEQFDAYQLSDYVPKGVLAYPSEIIADVLLNPLKYPEELVEHQTYLFDTFSSVTDTFPDTDLSEPRYKFDFECEKNILKSFTLTTKKQAVKEAMSLYEDFLGIDLLPIEEDKAKPKRETYNRKEIETLQDEGLELSLSKIETVHAFVDKPSKLMRRMSWGVNEFRKTGGNKRKDLKDTLIDVILSYSSENEDSDVFKRLHPDRPLTPMHRLVLQKIYTLVEVEGYSFFDESMIKSLIVNVENPRIQDDLTKQIKKCVEELQIIRCRIECDKKLQESFSGDAPVDYLSAEENILNLRKVNVAKSENKKEMWQLLSEPIYFKYIRHRNQIVPYSVKYLDNGIKRASELTILLTDYLATRIQDMKHQHRKNTKSDNYINKILFETLYDEVLNPSKYVVDHIPEDSSLEKEEKKKNNLFKTDKKRCREYTETMLKSYKEKKFIKDYSKEKDCFIIKI